MCLGWSYRHWESDGGDTESKACDEGGHAVYPMDEEEVSLFPSSQETRGDLKTWRKHGEDG